MLVNKLKLTLQIIALLLAIAILSACEKQVSNTAVSIDTNAYYSVFQNSANSDWRAILSDNAAFLLKTVTFTLDEGKPGYALIFACPSSKIGLPHEVHAYYSTSTEMELINFTCRKSLDDLEQKSVYGDVKGITIADATNPQGELVRIALLDEALDVWEAYATRIRAGDRDVVAFKGKESAEGGIAQGRFLIRRNINLSGTTEALAVDLDFDQSGFRVFTKAFSENARSTVNITRADSVAEIQTEIAFFSQNDTRITLVSSTEDKFTFLPVPLEEFTGERGTNAGSPEFLPGEAHAIFLTAKGTDGSEISRVSKFFTVSNGETHNIDLLKPISNSPQLSSKLTNDLQSVILKWDRYQDEVSGKADFYRWVLEGTAANFLSDKVPSITADRVKWYVTVTAGWLDAVGAAGDNYTLVLPEHFAIGSYEGPIETANSWRKEWGFRPGSLINWDMSAVVINDDGTIESVIDYMVNRNLSDNLQFSAVRAKSK